MEPKHSTFVDLEKGIPTQEGVVDSSDDDIGTIKVYADLCLLVLLLIFLGVAIVIFMKLSIWPAVGLTSFIGGMMFLMVIMVASLKYRYIEERMAGKQAASV